MSKKLFWVAVVFTFLFGFGAIQRATETPEQTADRLAADAPKQATKQAAAPSPCLELYKQWDAAYKLHNEYGDHMATQADVDYAKGVWRTCERNNDWK